jgi:hypothetical protein
MHAIVKSRSEQGKLTFIVFGTARTSVMEIKGDFSVSTKTGFRWEGLVISAVM